MNAEHYPRMEVVHGPRGGNIGHVRQWGEKKPWEAIINIGKRSVQVGGYATKAGAIRRVRQASKHA